MLGAKTLGEEKVDLTSNENKQQNCNDQFFYFLIIGNEQMERIIWKNHC